ncbi:DNA methyltransferase [Streptomyces sp. CC208A]|uniref:site-specific DNA-methyltransferase n=1 Tax=Streptomyces sp. CC208A TaxID=3044573 RepID=UPI0024A97E9C|nr:DNA methyltransferase [Streptomyces sp. CC208A]
MAHIDNLIASVQDPALRAALQAEYRKVLRTRQFGLVFNAHKPESVLLPKFAVRRGDKVCLVREGSKDRTDVDESGVWTVISLCDGTATIQSRTDPAQVLQVSHERVVIIREFGDPIYPGLRSTGRIARASDRPWHAVINAENYHALEALLYPYEGRIDAIYIDPPYNTGARDWKYNNDFVDDQDPYRHSKWLSFMEKRLQLAKRLLNPSSSVLIVTIDEKEVHRLGLLLGQVFPGAKCQMVTSVINTKGVARGREFSRVEEYLFFVYIGQAGPAQTPDNMLTAEGSSSASSKTIWLSMLRRGTDARRVDREKQFYPIFVDEAAQRIVSVGEPLLPVTADRSTVVPPPGTVAVWPLRTDGSEGRWQIGRDSFIAALADGTARLGRRSAKGQWAINYLNEGAKKRIEAGEITVSGRDENGALVLTHSEDAERAQTARTVWNRPSHDASTHGSTMLRSLIPGRKFNYPKSLYAVEDALRFFVSDKPDALILDFFGGSGTTAHAVARLNHQDGGRRRSIVVTNNEVSDEEAADMRARGVYPGDPEWESLGICQHITVPRIRAAFTGITADGRPVDGAYKFNEQHPMSDGYEENVEFFELTYEDPALVSLGRKFSAIAPLLWFKAGATGERIEAVADEGWVVPEEAVYGVLFDTTEWSDFVDAVNARHDGGRQLRHAFIVTDSTAEYQQIVAKLDPSLATTRLYEDYLRTFQINTSGHVEE